MNDSSINIRIVTMTALCIGINFLGGSIALLLRLPIYLDSIGTIFAGAIGGPVVGLVTGLLSGLLSGITTDVFSLYYSPVQIVTGLLAGFLLKGKLIKKGSWKIPGLAFLLSFPGTLVSSFITVSLFGGITSSGSSMIVQILSGLGMTQTVSVVLVQMGTDYLDRLLSVLVVVAVIAILPKRTLFFSRL
ncbi:ECF transporter S component [Enterococcus hermanniensis]|nr:ECF transporter S component [Enterococcus hermanniensis]